MTGPGSLPPLVVEFDVAVSPEHAFDVWTRRTRLWWPPSHTISSPPGASTTSAKALTMRLPSTGASEPGPPSVSAKRSHSAR